MRERVAERKRAQKLSVGQIGDPGASGLGPRFRARVIPV